MEENEFAKKLLHVGMSNTQFARTVGINPTTISRWKCGTQDAPKWSIVVLDLLAECRVLKMGLKAVMNNHD